MLAKGVVDTVMTFHFLVFESGRHVDDLADKFVVALLVVVELLFALLLIVSYVVKGLLDGDTEDRDSMASLLLPIVKVLWKTHTSYNDVIG